MGAEVSRSYRDRHGEMRLEGSPFFQLYTGIFNYPFNLCCQLFLPLRVRITPKLFIYSYVSSDGNSPDIAFISLHSALRRLPLQGRSHLLAYLRG